MEIEKINNNIIIYETSDNRCEKCYQILETKNIELKYEGFNTFRWQKEKLMYCKKCKNYYTTKEKIDDLNKKYPSYQIKEIGKPLTKKLSELECYVCTKRNHLVCNGKSTQDRFVIEKIVAENKEGKHSIVQISRCTLCDKYYINQKELPVLENKFKKINIKQYKEKNKLVQKDINHVPEKSKPISTLNVVIEKNKCLEEHHKCIKHEITINYRTQMHSLIKRNIKGLYCKECGILSISEEEFTKKFNGKFPENFNYKKMIDNVPIAKVNVSEKRTKDKFIEKINESNKISIPTTANFFVRTNVIKCITNRHNISEINAEIQVLNSNGKIENKIIAGYYCKQCNLCFIYNSEYERLRKRYIPLCTIYEYEKYLKNKQHDVNWRQESILHTFGYNVNSIDNLSELQRQKILMMLIETGVMSKHEIIRLLEYFIRIRKNLKTHQNAIRKWKNDIHFLNEVNLTNKNKVTITSIKLFSKI